MGKLRSISFEPPLRGTTSLAPGDLTMVPDDAGVDILRWRGVELLRGFAHPIRDADWGTNPTQTEDEQFSSDGQAASCIRDSSSVGGGLAGRFTQEASAEGRVALDDAAGPISSQLQLLPCAVSSQLQLPPDAIALFLFPHPAERAR